MTNADDETEVFEDAVCDRETDAAILVTITVPLGGTSGGHRYRKVWVPKSVIHDDSEVFDCRTHAEGKLILMSWFCRKEGLR